VVPILHLMRDRHIEIPIKLAAMGMPVILALEPGQSEVELVRNSAS